MKRAARDPEGRKRKIVQAAAELIMEFGPNAVTHRKVAERACVPLGSTTQYFKTLGDLLAAAMEELLRGMERDVIMLRQELQRSDDLPKTIARMISEYFADPERVRLETVFFAAHTQHPQLRHIASTWHERMVAELAAYVAPSVARAVATYVNGLTLEAMYREMQATEQEIEEVVAVLLAMPPSGGSK